MAILHSPRSCWSAMHLQLRVSILLAPLLLGSCGFVDWLGGKRPKQTFCEQHPDNQECQQEYPDADARCKSNADCMTPTGVCDLAGERMCVQCIAPTQMSACTGTTPACALEKMCVQCVAPDQTSACTGTTPTCAPDHTCQPCRKHQDCVASHACLADGSCAQVDQVAYVDPLLGGGATCTLTAPCKRIADALTTSRPILKLTGMIDEQIQIERNATLLADPGTKLTSTTNGIIVEARGSSQVTISDLTIAGASGPAGSGLGISLPPGSTASLTLSRVVIFGNQGGGISISGGQFDITNCVIAGNGSAQTSFGGVRFDQIDNGRRRFEFNTVADNVAKDGTSVGVVCTLVTQPLTFSNNIVYGNQIGGTRTQVGGANCNWVYSDIGPDTLSGTGNINTDPLFTNPSQNDFHIQPTSPVKGKADPGATVRIDIDGETRPQGGGYDMGADEIQ